MNSALILCLRDIRNLASMQWMDHASNGPKFRGSGRGLFSMFGYCTLLPYTQTESTSTSWTCAKPVLDNALEDWRWKVSANMHAGANLQSEDLKYRGCQDWHSCHLGKRRTQDVALGCGSKSCITPTAITSKLLTGVCVYIYSASKSEQYCYLDS